MSAMLKKGGAGFRPKAPQARRNVQPSPSSQGPERSSTAERAASKTPGPVPAPAASTPVPTTTTTTTTAPTQDGDTTALITPTATPTVPLTQQATKSVEPAPSSNTLSHTAADKEGKRSLPPNDASPADHAGPGSQIDIVIPAQAGNRAGVEEHNASSAPTATVPNIDNGRIHTSIEEDVPADGAAANPSPVQPTPASTVAVSNRASLPSISASSARTILSQTPDTSSANSTPVPTAPLPEQRATATAKSAAPTTKAQASTTSSPKAVKVTPVPVPRPGSTPSSAPRQISTTPIPLPPQYHTLARLAPIAPRPSIEAGRPAPALVGGPSAAARYQATQAATPPAEDRNPEQPLASIEAAGDAPAPTPAAGKGRKRKAGAAGQDDGTGTAQKRRRRKNNDAEQDGEPSATPKRSRKRKAPADDAGEDGGADVAAAKKPRRHRSVTPENAEELTIDPMTVTMAELTKDMRIGKKFSRHDELRERERERRAKKYAEKKAKQLGLEGMVGENQEGAHSEGSAPPGTADGAATTGVSGAKVREESEGGANKTGTPAKPATATAAAGDEAEDAGVRIAGPQFHIVDGQIVVDQQSLRVDRHRQADEERGELEEVHEDEFTRHVTSGTYMRRPLGANHWSAVDTEQFYRWLRMFGTDFLTISKMFPGKTRRQVKQKFNREERHCPRRVNAALRGGPAPDGGPDGGTDGTEGRRLPQIDLEAFKAASRLELEPVADIEAETRRLDEEFEAEERRIQEEAAEEARRKREELFGKPGGGDDGDQDEDADGAEVEQSRGKSGRARAKAKAKGSSRSRRKRATEEIVVDNE